MYRLWEFCGRWDLSQWQLLVGVGHFKLNTAHGICIYYMEDSPFSNKRKNLKTLKQNSIVFCPRVSVYTCICLCVGLGHVYLFYLCRRVFCLQFIKICHHPPNGSIKTPQLPFHTPGILSFTATEKQTLVQLLHPNVFWGSQWFMLLLSFSSSECWDNRMTVCSSQLDGMAFRDI